MKSVRELLSGKSPVLYSIGSQQTVLEAVRLMAEKTIGAVPVIDDGKLVGILSERDYARKVIVLGRNSTDTKVAEIMTPHVLTVALEDRAYQCMSIMTDKKIRHLPVVDHGKVVGMLSIGDLVRAVIEDQRLHIARLEQFIAS
jgi:CBS domain-containing protein